MYTRNLGVVTSMLLLGKNKITDGGHRLAQKLRRSANVKPKSRERAGGSRRLANSLIYELGGRAADRCRLRRIGNNVSTLQITAEWLLNLLHLTCWIYLSLFRDVVFDYNARITI
ncbi:hypothetical protein EVAR_84886_1 [Eumeta japonica]|uniref:Uncharacterized protein n=1 Tax=Eumeta variegata TaxID=151549 RepID=A0A4C1YI94_EUMVA|nr:hypothetical protein EVAR_84886_1 [Eumeta japonica]